MRKVGLILGAVVLLAAALGPAFAAAQPFADVPQDHWAYDAIAQLAQQGVIEGFPDGTFKGNRSMTRYEFAVAIARIMEKLQSGGQGAGPVGPQGPQGPAGPPGPPGTGVGLTPEQQTLLQRLQNEFQPELRALRADLEALTQRVAALEAQGPAAPRVQVNGNFGWRMGSYGTKLAFGDKGELSTGFPALESPAFGEIVVPTAVPIRIPISDSTKDPFKVNDFALMRATVNLSAQLADNASAMVSLLAAPTNDFIFPNHIGPDGGQGGATSPSAFSGNGVLDAVTIDQAYAKFGVRFFTPISLVVGKQYLKRGVGLLFDNDQMAIPAFRADAGSNTFRVGAFVGMLSPDAFFGRAGVHPFGLDQFGNVAGMYGGTIGADALVSGASMYEARGQDNYNLIYADLQFLPGWRVGANWLASGFSKEQGWSASLNGGIFGLNLYGEFARLTKWPFGENFADKNLNGIRDPGEGKLDKSDSAWLAGLGWKTTWLEVTGEYGQVDAGYAFSPAFQGWDTVGGPGFFNLPLSILHPRAEIDPYDINWVDRPLYLDPTNIAKGWHVALAFPTLLGPGNGLNVSYATGDAYSTAFLAWLFNGASGAEPGKWRDADPFWTVSLSHRMSDSVTASLLYGRREVDNVMSPRTIPIQTTPTTVFASQDPIQVLRAQVAVQF